MTLRPFATATLLIALALAGCLAEPKTPDVPVDDTIGQTLQWVFDAAGNRLDPSDFPGELPAFDIVKVSDRISGEPTIGITRTGAVFYPAIDFDVLPENEVRNLPKTYFMRSTDAGATWVDKSPKIMGVSTHPDSSDPYVYVDPTTGRVFALDMAPSLTCNRVSWSDDDGETWMTREGACIPGVNDHPSLFAGPATQATNKALYPNQLYLCTNQVTDSICYQSSDGGLTWIATTPAFVGVDPFSAEVDPSDPPFGPIDAALQAVCGGLTGHGHASWADGTVYLGRDWCGEASVAVSHDGGLTFTRAIISNEALHDPTDHDVSVGTDSDGNAYAFWVANGGRAVFLSRSLDQGKTWDTPINVTAPGVTAVKLPSLVAGSAGRIAFLYVGTDAPLGWEVQKQRECNDDEEEPCYEHPDDLDVTTWNAYIGVSLNADGAAPIFATVLANERDSPVKRGPCGGRCFGDQGGMYDFLDIDIDPRTGQLWAALVDVCSGDCDGPGKAKSDVEEKAVGAAARMIGGTPLLESEIPART